MATLLYLEASPRKERSHSIRVANGFLDAYAAAHPADTIDRLDIWAEDLPPFDGDMINAKYTVMHGENPSGAEEAAWAEVQRERKRQPLGSASGCGTVPGISCSFSLRSLCISGSDWNRPKVYGWRGSAKSASVLADSTTLPAYITATRSEIWRTTDRSCAMNT